MNEQERLADLRSLMLAAPDSASSWPCSSRVR